MKFYEELLSVDKALLLSAITYIYIYLSVTIYLCILYKFICYNKFVYIIYIYIFICYYTFVYGG